jgi:hypothetical protein
MLMLMMMVMMMLAMMRGKEFELQFSLPTNSFLYTSERGGFIEFVDSFTKLM